ncbi:MAG: hypothetical protein ACRC68_17005, partial [Clostridium sp.]
MLENFYYYKEEEGDLLKVSGEEFYSDLIISKSEEEAVDILGKPSHIIDYNINRNNEDEIKGKFIAYYVYPKTSSIAFVNMKDNLVTNRFIDEAIYPEIGSVESHIKYLNDLPYEVNLIPGKIIKENSYLIVESSKKFLNEDFTEPLEESYFKDKTVLDEIYSENPPSYLIENIIREDSDIKLKYSIFIYREKNSNKAIYIIFKDDIFIKMYRDEFITVDFDKVKDLI